MRLLSLFFFLFVSTSLQAQSLDEKALKVCAILKKNQRVNILGEVNYLHKGEGFLVVGSEFKTIRSKKSKRSKKIKFLKISLGDVNKSLPEKYFSISDLSYCGIIGDIVLLNKERVGKVRLSSKSNAVKLLSKGPYKVVSIYKKNKNVLLRLRSGRKLVFMDPKWLKAKYSRSELLKTQEGWYQLFGHHFLLHAASAQNAANAPYEGMITEIPDSSDVYKLQDPIINEISTGSGFVFGFSTLFKEHSSWNIPLGIYFSQIDYQAKGLKNPEVVGPISYDQLSEKDSIDFTQKSVHITTGFLKKHTLSYYSRLHYGFIADFQIKLNDPEITVKAGCPGPCLSKNQDLVIQATPSSVISKFGIRGAYAYSKFNLYLDIYHTQELRLSMAYELF